MQQKSKVLFVIVLAQFLATSLWFAGNAVMGSLLRVYQLSPTALGTLTSAVQFGFILGTLVFAYFTIADRYSPSIVFFISALLGALANIATTLPLPGSTALVATRFFTGFFLAGIYPVGMKIAADYHQRGLGKALGFLVGALVLGTAFPHVLNSLSIGLPWNYVLYVTSGLAIVGGVLIKLFVPDGPFRKPSLTFNAKAGWHVFKNKAFRSAAIGYFGHMWELYAFWAFVPLLLKSYALTNGNVHFNIPLFSFLIIGVGSIACILGGYLSQFYGSKRVAILALLGSCICCLVSPLAFVLSPNLFLVFVFIWSVLVIADSPQFSSLVAQSAPPQIKGTALTLVNSIGFAITILSIQLINYTTTIWQPTYVFVILAVGPLVGVLVLLKNKAEDTLSEMVS